jgi:HTH-type transcriptional regulator/antitoxin HipB
MSLNVLTTKDTILEIAHKCRDLRTFRNLSRKTLALTSGVPEPTIKRFESTGHISLASIVQLADALGVRDAFLDLFQRPAAKSLDEIEERDRTLRKKTLTRGRL